MKGTKMELRGIWRAGRLEEASEAGVCTLPIVFFRVEQSSTFWIYTGEILVTCMLCSVGIVKVIA